MADPTARRSNRQRHLLATILTVAGVAAVVCAVLTSRPAPPTATSTAPPDRSTSQNASAPMPTHAPRPGRAKGLLNPDGSLPARVTVFDEQYAGVAQLDPALRQALQNAATRANRDGVTVYVNSGWRSRQHQEELLDEAVATYGSLEEAARWVATPDTSSHVTGEAVDIGHSDAVTWLAEHGAAFGLCQVYDNEPWHFELRPDAVQRGCPATYADPTEDPRLR